MKIIKTLQISIFCLFIFLNTYSQVVYFSEGFENEGNKPLNWKNIAVTFNHSWEYHDGGHGPFGFDEALTFPDTACNGNYNAVLYYDNSISRITKLVTPLIDLEFAVKPELRFWHAQIKSGDDQDELAVYYRVHEDSVWRFLEDYTSEVSEWTERKMFLPDTSLSGTYYIAFEGKTKWGHGVCIDSVQIVETGIIPSHVEEVLYDNYNNEPVSTGSSSNPIIKIRLKIYGNTGNIILDSLAFKSLNDNDGDLSNNGVKLFYTKDENFNTAVQLGSSKNFSGGTVVFDNLDYTLTTGYSYLWLTYDCVEGATPGNIFDAAVLENSFKLRIDTSGIEFNENIYVQNDSLYYKSENDTLSEPIILYVPDTEQSPDGSRSIVENIFYDFFDTDKGWSLEGEFEIDAPQGLGDSINGSPDPEHAFIGSNVLGYDLTDNGNYEPNISTSYMAESPVFDCYYYKNVKLTYYRWLNIEKNDYDKAFISLSADSGNTWKTIWNNPKADENFWSYHSLDASFTDRKRNAKLAFILGPTDGSTSLSGWNIDNLAVIGDYITRDISIQSWVTPVSGCGHSDNDTVKVMLKNSGANTLNDTVILFYSFSGALNKTAHDTLIVNLMPEEELLYAFSETVDLSSPYFYDSSQVFASVTLKNDQYQLNDTAWKELLVIPTYRPLFTEDFEAGFGYWQKIGAVNSWEYGTPNGTVIDSAASGDYAWVTRLDSAYRMNDSSYLESPCFDFSNARNPVFEWKYRAETQSDTDGVAIFYSIDTGATWQLVDTHQYDFHWNWYEKDMIEALGTPGWDSVTDGYVTAKQFLPPETGNKPLVKFRVGFQAMDSTVYEGIAFDDIRVYDAPPDLGIDTILAPNSACELSAAEEITVAVRNYGMHDVLTGDTIMIGIVLDNNPIVIDTFVMIKNIPVGDTVHQTLTKPFNFYQAGWHHIKAFPVTKVDNNIYSDSTYNNDTTTKSVLVKKPYVELGPDIYSVHPDTVVLNAYDEPDNYYVWKESGSPDTLSTDSVYAVPGEGTYVIIVKNNVPCYAKDTIYIEQLIADVGVSALNSPFTDCELGDSVPLTFEIKNFGTDTIKANYPVKIYYQVGNNPLWVDDFMINDTIWPDSTFLYTCDSVVNMVNDTIYDIVAFTEYIDDTIPVNDTLITSVEVYGYPEFSLSPDDTTLVGFSYTLNAARGNHGLVTYLWEDSLSIDSLLVVDSLGVDYYTVTVADIHNCPAVDSAKVKLVIPSVGVTDISFPLSSCGPIQTEIVNIKVANLMNDTIYTGEKIPLIYQIDSDPAVNDTLELSTDMHPGDTLDFSFASSVTISILGKYNLLSYTNLDRDSIPGDDSTAISVGVYPQPNVNLGNDTTIEASEYTLDAGAVFGDYLWHDGTGDQTFEINPETIEPLRNYAVTVTDTNGCLDDDIINVDLLFDDITVAEMFFPDTACSYGDTHAVQVKLTNTGTYILNNNDIVVSYILNDGQAKHDSFNIQGTLFTGASFIHTFNSTATMSDEGKYIFKVIANLKDDAYQPNDTLIDSVYLYGLPEVDFSAENDTLEEYLPAMLDPGAGYVSYEWQDGSSGQTYEVNSYGWYTVTVTDDNSCQGIQTVYVSELVDIIKINNKGIVALLYPNPARDKLYLDINVDEPAVLAFEVLDINGKALINKKISVQSAKKWDIDISAFSAGIYYLRLYGIEDNNVITRKILVVD